MKLSKLKHLTTSILSIASSAFSYILCLYLLCVLLENVFPGFVSNTFDVNLLLVPVLASGILAAFAPEEKRKKSEKPTLRDYALGLVLAIVGGVIIYYKTHELGGVSIALSLLSTLLIALVSFLTIQEEPVEATEVNENDEEGEPVDIRKMVGDLFRFLFAKRLPIPISLLIAFTLVIAVIWNRSVFKTIPQATPTPTQEQGIFNTIDKGPTVNIPPVDELSRTPVTLLWGGVTKSEALDIAKLLIARGLMVTKIADAGRIDYADATVSFRPQEASVAAYLIDGLQNVYANVIRTPSQDDTKPDITVILGSPSQFME